MKKWSNIIFILYFVTICLFPLGVVLRFSPASNINIYPQDLVVGLISVFTLYTYLKKPDPKYSGLFKSIVIFNAISLISLLLNPINLNVHEFIVSISYLVRFDAYISLLFFGIFNLGVTRTVLLKRLLIVSSITFILFGFVQYFFYNNLRNLYYLGWDEHLYRLFSTFLDPNYTGLLIVLVLLLFLGHIYSEKKITRFLLAKTALIVFAFIAMLLTHSRTALLSLAFAGSFFFVLNKRFKVLFVSILLLVVSTLLVSDFSVEGLNPIRIASSEARVASMQEAFEIFKDSPIYGIGFNAYRYAQYDKGFRKETVGIYSNADASTDNSFLFVLATTGAIGFILYINIWIKIVKRINVCRAYFEKTVVYSIIVALFVGSFFINALFYMPILLWVYLMVGTHMIDE